MGILVVCCNIKSSKRRKNLECIDEIARQFLIDADHPVYALEIGFLMPEYMDQKTP